MHFYTMFLILVYYCFLQSVVDKLLKKANVSLVVGTSSWREQFVEAITVSPGTYSMSKSNPSLFLFFLCPSSSKA